MELTRGRLTAALIAGKIPVTDQALKFLQAGLVTIARGYHLNKVLRAVKTPTELRKELSRLYQACRTFLDVFDADLNGLGQIEALLSDTWPGGQLVRVVADLRCFYDLNPQTELALNWHLEVLAAKLTAVREGKIRRLMINKAYLLDII
jgi:hypothetical protein